MTEVRDITLEIGEQEFTFTLTPVDVTKYFNALTQNNKVAPGNNLLVTTVKQEERATLKPLLVNPVRVMQLTGLLLEQYSPEIEAVVKKPLDTLSA